MLRGVVCEVLPQIGSIVLQDYARLNDGMILADQLLHVADQSQTRLERPRSGSTNATP